MFTLFANGVDWKKWLVVQNDKGWYYWNGKNYYRTVLSLFDTLTVIPAGFKIYKDDPKASHKKLPHLRRIDFSLNAGTKITANEDVKINGYPPNLKGKSRPYAVSIVKGNTHILLNHVQCDYDPGTIVKAGNVIARVNTQAQNIASAGDFPPHLDIHTQQDNDKWDKRSIRELILASDTTVIVDPHEDCNKKLKDALQELVNAQIATKAEHEKVVNLENAHKKDLQNIQELKEICDFNGDIELFKRYLRLIQEKALQYDNIRNVFSNIWEALRGRFIKLISFFNARKRKGNVK